MLRTAEKLRRKKPAVRGTSSLGSLPQGKIPFGVTCAYFSDSF
ncbi:MAG TPA: hypothetical protein VL981_06270 [Candidatus Methylacidiphilales bacterium]|nr:hypothetical protein [Candidatus Methylacidiphilales bacterium]